MRKILIIIIMALMVIGCIGNTAPPIQTNTVTPSLINPSPTPEKPHLWAYCVVWHSTMNNRTMTIYVENDGAPGIDTCTLVVHANPDVFYTRKISLGSGDKVQIDYDLSNLSPGTYKAAAYVKPEENMTFNIMIK